MTRLIGEGPPSEHDFEAARLALSEWQANYRALDPVLLASLAEDLRQLVNRAPPELGQALPEFQAIRDGDLVDLVRSVSPGLLAHLAKAG